MLRTLSSLLSRSVRYRLLVLVLLPILLIYPAALWITFHWSQHFSNAELFRKVQTDLAVAHDLFHRIQRDYLQRLEQLAESYEFRTALDAGDQLRLNDQLDAVEATTGLDFLSLHLLPQTAHADSVEGVRNDRSPLLAKAWTAGDSGVGVEVWGPPELRAVDPDLPAAVRVPLLDTPRALPARRVVEDRAMLIRAVYPVRDRAGAVRAVLDGGVVLNRNFALVDQIRDLVYGPGSVAEDGWGTVTVFLDDVRISTNVPLERGERALGTRVSQEVREKVLQRGETWVDRAFVVNDWYISAYEPVTDVHGARVGLLYAGYVEAPYRRAYLGALAILTLMLLGAAGIVALFVVRGARTVFEPLETMASVIRATQAGEDRRVGALAAQNELGELAREFDRMLDLLRERSRQVEQSAEQLERKVRERTRELRSKNEDLQRTVDLLGQTRRQLVVAEKLAALGELTAGVAHEINNPTAVILGNMDVLVRDLGEHVGPVRTEVDLIIEQVYRIRTIIDKLLQYSRPAQSVGTVEWVDVNAVVDDTLKLTQHELRRREMRVSTHLQVLTPVRINRQELQQVLINLIVNAVHSSSVGGDLEIETSDRGQAGVVVDVTDHGTGIPAADLTRVFDPFFTTRKDSGTGLGLSVSYGLIRQHGGRISVESEQGAWTRFRVHLLREPALAEVSDG